MDLYKRVPMEFKDLKTVYKIALTLPVTTASVERAFSKLSLVKTKIRSTMSQDRLEALVLASVEKDILVALSIDELVSKFAALQDRRIEL